MKRFSILILLFLIGFSLGGQVVRAEDDSTFGENASDCMDQLGNFLISLLDTMAFEDYWQDYFVRNQCQQDDIFALDDEIENLLDELRNEYVEHCASEEIPQLKIDIRMKKMEMYFVRHIVEFDEKSIYKKDEESAQAAAEQKSDTRYVSTTSDGMVIDTTNVIDKMNERYVEKKKWVETKEELEELVEGWVSDYEHRIPQYWGCSVSPWEEVADKAIEFWETLTAFNELNSFKEQAAEIQKEYQDTKAEREAELEATGATSGGEKDGPPKGLKAIGNFFKKHFKIRLQEIDPPKSTTELAEESGGLVTFNTAQDLMIGEEERYKNAYDGSKLIGNYWKLYKENYGDIGATLASSIYELSGVIDNSSQVPSFLPGLQQAAKEIHKKAGSGKAGG
ncbi:hypothetical protein HN748_04380 [Candidatus Peregrinibacteria bacterium]|jgi:hypothetical protein|nr:hypothetical protein [Candidatus Peregrinibacteria bacterium]MBT7483958.1 hypothetical protein [Candidatus Peregrinibacteria bacterium]MBT7703447.1 hypothetical protein [Candidatus Peregrinibacteria bacterium]